MIRKTKIHSKNPVVKSCFYRGLVLHAFIYLENDMSACLAEFFSGNNDYYWTFMEVIGDRMTFESKRASLKFLMERIETKQGFIKTKNNRYKCADLFNELRLLNDQRNYFAHYIFYNMPSRKEYAIVLTDYRDNGNEHFYIEEDIDKLLIRIDTAKKSIVEIYMNHRKSTEAVPDED